MAKKELVPNKYSSRAVAREVFIQNLSKVHPNIEIEGEYINARQKVKWKCKTCGSIGYDQPKNMLRCKVCKNCDDKLAENRKQKTVELKNLLSETMPTVKVIGEYTGYDKKIQCQCLICGNVFESLAGNLRKNEGCPTCGRKKLAQSLTKTHEKFVNEVETKNPKIDIIGQYKKDNEKVACQCKTCGFEWEALPTNILKGSGCPNCAKNQTSFMEKSIYVFLQDALGEGNVVARDRSAINMELDIYIPSLKVAIEPGGWVWHYHRLDKDRKKAEACDKNNIRLIVIYDYFNGDISELKLQNAEVLTYKHNIGNPNRKGDLRDCIISVFEKLNLAYKYSAEEEKTLFDKARILTQRKSNEEVVEMLLQINPNIELLSRFHNDKEKMSCKCAVCGHNWESDYDHLIRRKQGCPACYKERMQRKVKNVDTGEVFESIVSAAKKIGVTNAAVRAACIGVVKKCKGYRWEYV